MPVPAIGFVTVWVVTLLVPVADTDSRKLEVHTFDTKRECEANIPYLKRYYRLYGDNWEAECMRTRRFLPTVRPNPGSG